VKSKYKNLFIFIMLVLSMRPSLAQESPPFAKFAGSKDDIRWSDFFKQNQWYEFSAGARGLSAGIVKFKVAQDNVIELSVPLAFYGSGTFSRATVDEVKRVSLPRVSPDKDLLPYGRHDINSFNDHPPAREAILRLTSNIEKIYNSSGLVRLHIDASFPNDQDFISGSAPEDYTQYIVALRDGVASLRKGTAIPVTVVARPEASRASPGEWDIYSDARLYAHELFHVLGVDHEGYELFGYPPNGIMQDEYSFHAVDALLKAKGRLQDLGLSRIYLPDLVAMMSMFGGELKDISPAPLNPERLQEIIDKYFSIISGDADVTAKGYSGRLLIEYTGWTHAERVQHAEKNVQEWFEGQQRQTPKENGPADTRKSTPRPKERMAIERCEQIWLRQ